MYPYLITCLGVESRIQALLDRLAGHSDVNDIGSVARNYQLVPTAIYVYGPRHRPGKFRIQTCYFNSLYLAFCFDIYTHFEYLIALQLTKIKFFVIIIG